MQLTPLLPGGVVGGRHGQGEARKKRPFLARGARTTGDRPDAPRPALRVTPAMSRGLDADRFEASSGLRGGHGDLGHVAASFPSLAQWMAAGNPDHSSASATDSHRLPFLEGPIDEKAMPWMRHLSTRQGRVGQGNSLRLKKTLLRPKPSTFSSAIVQTREGGKPHPVGRGDQIPLGKRWKSPKNRLSWEISHYFFWISSFRFQIKPAISWLHVIILNAGVLGVQYANYSACNRMAAPHPK